MRRSNALIKLVPKLYVRNAANESSFHVYYIIYFLKKQIKKRDAVLPRNSQWMRSNRSSPYILYVQIQKISSEILYKKIKLRCVLHLFLYRFKERK